MHDGFAWQATAAAGRCVLGEGPTWSIRHQSLFWVDILGQSLQRLDGRSGKVDRWLMPAPVCWIVERANCDSFVIGLGREIAILHLDPFSIERVLAPGPTELEHRLNDAKVGPDGALWFGTMPVPASDAGALNRMEANWSWSEEDTGYSVPNGPAFSPDGKVMYHCDSRKRTIYAYDFSGSAAPAPRRTFVTFSRNDGLPDGMTTDAAGQLWVAMWGRGRINIFLPNGMLRSYLTLPVRNVSSVAFGGAALDMLYVTSASVHDQSDLAGTLFQFPGIGHGCPPGLFPG